MSTHHEHHGSARLFSEEQGARPSDNTDRSDCGMTVSPASPHKAEHAGRSYAFCSAAARTRFMANPAQYVDADTVTRPAEDAPPGTIYTCPMHPEIQQTGPGSCPKCGMALATFAAHGDRG